MKVKENQNVLVNNNIDLIKVMINANPVLKTGKKLYEDFFSATCKN